MAALFHTDVTVCKLRFWVVFFFIIYLNIDTEHRQLWLHGLSSNIKYRGAGSVDFPSLSSCGPGSY